LKISKAIFERDDFTEWTVRSFYDGTSKTVKMGTFNSDVGIRLVPISMRFEGLRDVDDYEAVSYGHGASEQDLSFNSD
jgi:hypothetical protein